MTLFVVLLRGINVNGRKLVMKELAEAAKAAGHADFRTYIQSGNLLFSATGSAGSTEAAIEALVAQKFGMTIEAIARSAEDFAALAAANPFPDGNPKAVHLCLAKKALHPETADRLHPRAVNGERIAVAGEALWIDFAQGVADSKLMPNILDKAAGSTVTARNLNTVARLIEMAGV